MARHGRTLKADVVPHMGWNTVEAPEDSQLFAGLDADARYYFVHSYAAHDWSLEVTNAKIRVPKVTWATHGERFVAAVENGALWATQFHPEKSGDAGRPAADQLDRDAVMPKLELLPAVDVRDGQAVRLVHGESGSETSYGSPLEAALAWQRAGCRVAAPRRPGRRLRHRRQPRPDRRGRRGHGHQGRAVRRHPRRRLARRRPRHRLPPGQPRHRRPGDPRVGRQGHRRARRQDRRRPRRPGHHPARPGLDPRRRRPLRDPRPPRRRGLRPLRRHRHRQGRHPGRPQPGPAAGRLRRHRPPGRRLRRGLLARRPPRDLLLVPEGVEGAIVGKALYAKAFTLEEALKAVAV